MRKIPTEVYSRVVGYFRPINQWNPGKQEEFRERKEAHVNLDVIGSQMPQISQMSAETQ